MTITLERLQHSDINLLRELRNANADAFFDDTYVTKEMQEDWWWRLQNDHRVIQFYTIWLNKVTPVGFLSVCQMQHAFCFDVREIGNLLLAPAHRGRGIMAEAITEVRRLHDPLTFWIAHVKRSNKASLALFERQDFVKLPNKRSRRCPSPESKPSTKSSSPTCSTSLVAKSNLMR